MAYATEKPGSLRKWLRIHFLSGHLKNTGKGRKVLDLCCGWGFYFKINPDAWGVDIDAGCIEYLLRQGYKVKQGNVTESLPFSDGAFDLVMAHDALEHFSPPEVKKIFGHVYRVLKKDGEFMVVVPNQKGYDHGLKTDCGHKHFITPEEVRDIAGEQFAVVKFYPHPLPRIIGRYFTHNKEVIVLRKV